MFGNKFIPEKLIQWLKDIDVSLFLWFNGKHNDFFDLLMFWVSHKYFWIWFYVILLAIVFIKLRKKIIIVLPAIALMILISDRTSGMIKESVQRPRPCHNKYLENRVHINKECGGNFGFVSSHSANTFALALFLSVLVGKNYRRFPYLIFAWASFVSFSRIYNGVHYPADVFGGALVGLFSAYLVSKLYFYIDKKYLV